jgi:anti-sigma-K factor RskA
MGRTMKREAARLIPHEPFDEWSILAPVGALDGDERQRFDAHLAAGCARCEARLREFSAVAATLPRALPDVPVPAGLRDRVLARVAQSEEPTAPSLRAERRTAAGVRPWMGGLVAAGLLGVIAWGIHDTRSTLQRQQAAMEQLQRDLARHQAVSSLVSHTDTSVASLRGTAAAGRADGWIVWSPGRKQGFVVIHHLPRLAPGKQYQLWAIAGQRPQAAGVFDVDAVGHAALVVEVDAQRPDLFAVTVEGTGGAPSPTGPIVMEGTPAPG